MFGKTKTDEQVKAPRQDEAKAKRDRVKILTYVTAAACALAVGAVAYAVTSVSGAQGELSKLQAETVPVVIAKQELGSGTTIAADAVELVNVPRTYAPTNALSDLESVVGKTTSTNIPANGQLTASSVAGTPGASTLALALEPGTVAASISVDAQTGVAGLLRQGDYIDILAEGAPIVENARVLALDASLSPTEGEYATVTVELTVEQAGTVQNAQVDSDVRLVLHSEADKTPHATETSAISEAPVAEAPTTEAPTTDSEVS